MRPTLGEARFAVQHASANVAGANDAVTAFSMDRAVGPNAVTPGAWDDRQLAGTSQSADSALSLGELGRLEDDGGAGACRYQTQPMPSAPPTWRSPRTNCASSAWRARAAPATSRPGGASRSSTTRSTAPTPPRSTTPGALLASHVRRDDEFIPTAVEHHARNKLGAEAARLPGATSRCSSRGSAASQDAVAPASIRGGSASTKPVSEQRQEAMTIGRIDVRTVATAADGRGLADACAVLTPRLRFPSA